MTKPNHNQQAFNVRKRLLSASALIATMIFTTAAPSTSLASGVRALKSGGPGRIYNGDDVRAGQGPWAVVLKKDTKFHCGGSLVHPQSDPSDEDAPVTWIAGKDDPRWVITAAHCLYDRSGRRLNKDQLRVLTGSRHRLNQTEDSEGKGEELAVRKIIEHQGYDSNTLRNDIALLQLEEPTKKLEKALRAAIGLPSRAFGQTNNLELITAPYTQVIAQGWGATEKSNSALVLQEVRLPLVDNMTCNASYSQAGAPLEPGMICAGYARGEYDSCQGDSGGPLIFRPANRAINEARLVGAVSWGIGCAQPNMPGVYSSIPYFQTWLDRAYKRCTSATSTKKCETVSLVNAKIAALQNRAVGNMITGQVRLSPAGCEKDPEGVCRLDEILRFEQSPNLVWESDLWTSDALQSGTTDGATIPKWAQPVIGGKFDRSYLKAAILHDHYCYKENHVRSWQSVHRMFYEALLASGISRVKAKTMYYAVYLGGPRWSKLVPGENCGVGCLKQRLANGETPENEWIDPLYKNQKFAQSVRDVHQQQEENSELTLAELEKLAEANRLKVIE